VSIFDLEFRHLVMKATITSKGQVTIPVEVRRKLNLLPGQILEFDDAAPHLKATWVSDPGEMPLSDAARTKKPQPGPWRNGCIKRGQG